MLPRTMTIGLGVMAIASAIAVLGAGVGNPGGASGNESELSTTQHRAWADKVLAAESRHINRASVGETRVAAFLGAEFGTSESAILSQKRSLRASWGNLTIAHTLATSDDQGMTVAEVLHLHDSGMGWGQIAAGLRMNLRDAVRAVKAESRVARGRAKADGKTAPIRGN